MEIDRKLNLVIGIDQGKWTIYVHSMPISAEIFKRYYKVIGRTFSEIFKTGLDFTAGPRVAAMLLEDVARALNMWDGTDGVQNGLLNEIRRLTHVVLPDQGGAWTVLPMEEVVRRKLISDEDLSEVDNAIVFFIVSSAMHRRPTLKAMMEGAALLWGGQITQSNVTEFAAGLQTLMPAENTGAKATRLSIPS